MSTEPPQKLGEKLKQIRERGTLTPDEFAQYVNAKDGTEITAYENDESDLTISVLYSYARFAGVPIENLLDDGRDLWTGHRQIHEHYRTAISRTSRVQGCLAVIGLVALVLFGLPYLLYLLDAIVKLIAGLWAGLRDL